MKAIILAAGRGSRLGRLTEDKPKCLNLVGGRSILERQLSILNSCGIKDIVVVSGYKAEMLSKFKVRTLYNPEWGKTNMVKSLLRAGEEFSDTAIVSYSDILYNVDVIRSLLRQKVEATVVYDLEWEKLWKSRFVDPLEDAESFRIGTDNRITEIGQKVDSLGEIQGQYIGLMRFTPLAFSWIEDFTRRQDKSILDGEDMTSLLNRMIQARFPIHGLAIRGNWFEIDSAGDIELANRYLKEEMGNSSGNEFHI